MLNLDGYIEQDLLYAGSRTMVYRARRSSDRQSVIVKVLRNPHPNFNELIQFRNQYAIARNLEHPAIVRPEALERYGNAYALVMPDEGAISLNDYWKKSALNLTEFLAIAIQLTEALHYLIQQRIVHKDIKPSNILIDPETRKVKLIDFSISTLLPKEQQQLTNPNVLEGTLAYISPEQTGRTNRGIDYRTDFYSLGVTFYELLAGRLPFSSNDPMELVYCHIARMPSALGTLAKAKGKRGGEIPGVLSDIVLKLMAKNAEDRYQSAMGMKYDLERCLELLETTGEIAAFEIATRDISDRFLIPEKLYGREAEVRTLLDAFQRVSSGKAEMMLVAGFSGIGKTAVVSEVRKPIVEKRGYFIKGKFDQFNRNIPFSAFVIAFGDLMGQLLGSLDGELQEWKASILEAVGENGQVIIDAIPALERIIGPQPPVPKLSGSEAQNRFNLLFGKFARVFTTKEHPLVIFLDDLQWADSASLNLLKLLACESDTGYLLLLGAYRDNEVFPAHPLMLTLDEIKKQGANIDTLTIAPLGEADITRMVADTLLCSTEIAAPLSELVYLHTGGNPFFTTQFLTGLHEDGWIAFEGEALCWQCDLARVRQLSLTDDVVEFMVGRLRKLPEGTQSALKLAACTGNQFDLATLAIASDRTRDEVAADLWTALQDGFAIPENQTYKFFQGETRGKRQEGGFISPLSPHSESPKYKFLHDRVQQAAYSLIPKEQKIATHYRIGQLLLQNIPPVAREERIFEVVGQLNYGIDLITEETERVELAKLNLIACRKARSATAYQGAFEYATTGLSLLGAEPWQRQYEMSLAFHDDAAELASICGDFEAMERFAETVIARTRSLLERVNVYRLKIQSNFSQNKLSEAITLALQFLQQLGVTFPENPTEKDIQQVVTEVNLLIGDGNIEDLVRLPAMTDVEKNAIVQIATSIVPASYISGSPLCPLLIALSVKLSIQYGNNSASATAYVWHGIICCNMLQDIETGARFGQLALQVVSKLNAKAVKSEIFSIFGVFVLHHKFHIKETPPLSREGYVAALEVGNLESVGYNSHSFCLGSFWSGQPLATLEKETRAYNHSLVQFNQLITGNWCRIHWQSMLNLLSVAEEPTILSGEALQESEFLPGLIEANDLTGLYYFYLYKLMLSYLFGDIEAAQNHALEVRRYFMGAVGTIGEPVFYFYDSLSALAALSSGSQEMERVEENQSKLQEAARYARMNYQHKVDLVEAEKCRVKGEKIEAIELYDSAIAGAKENEYIQEEGLANELAAKFYLDWGKEKIAATYMQEAYYCYARWEAKAKTDRLEEKYPQLLAPIVQQQEVGFNVFGSLETITQTLTSIAQTQTSGTGVSDTLDLASILQAAQTLSDTMELEELLGNIARIILSNSGAEKAVLLAPVAEEWQLRAMARLTADGNVEISTKSQPLTAESPAPVRLIRYVKNTAEPVLIDEGKTDITGIIEGYILEKRPQSVFCTPMLYRGNLVAILYLEHPTTKGVFASDRQTVVQFLCSQAGISLQNAQLYERAKDALRDLQQAQLQLVQSEKMSALGNLVAGVAHEINNPTGFLQGNIKPARDYVEDLLGLIELYQTEYPQPNGVIEEEIEDIDLEFIREDLPDLLESMNAGVERIRSISTSLRTFSRKDRELKTDFNIHDGIDSTLVILKHRTKANQQRPEIEIVKDYKEIPVVQCFPGQLNQVFMNILANAIDAFEEANEGKTYFEIEANPNRITIRTSILDEERVQIEIIDNGSGMKPETQDRIFEQGFTTKGVGKGTGLGMAIAHNIVTEKHGGTITCNSKLGVGTTFTIVLPMV